MEDIFRTLKRAGIRRNELYLAWDFTVASERNLSERLLSIRDDAFAQLGDTDLDDLTVQGSSPQFAVTRACDDSGCTPPEQPELGCSDVSGNSRVARCVEGRVLVPCYLNAPGCPTGSQFAYGLEWPAASDPRQHGPRQFPVHRPALGGRGRNRHPADRRSTATACSATRRR